MRRNRWNPELAFGCLIVLAFAAVALAAPLLAPPNGKTPYLIPQQAFSGPPSPPSAEHPLGLNARQADNFYGMVWGARVAFRVGLLVTLGRTLIGVLVGVLAGFYRGWVDSLLMRLTDAFLAFPVVAAVLVMVAIFGGPFLIQATGADRVIQTALILFGWMAYARLIRGNMLLEREKEYVQAAVALGAPPFRLLVRHILPNAVQGLLVLIASDIGAMVTLTSLFHFLGFSGNTLLADWGQMLNLSRSWVLGTPGHPFAYWYTYLPPAAAIVLFSTGWSLIGDGLRDVLDPRLR